MPDIEDFTPSAENILIVENAVPADMCHLLREHMDAEYAKNPSVSEAQRTAFVVPMNEEIDLTVFSMINQQLSTQVEPYFRRTVEWWERPHLLRYSVGGLYGVHADADNENEDRTGWVRILDRDISMVFYLNDNFKGGALYFKELDMRIQPKEGMMVAFPSHHAYRHMAEPTEEGVRYAIASWATVYGSPRVVAEHPPGCVYRNDFH
jgi:predicted 2-oxoglutarate/Fe(II)-dependent dioxygenase YbiX